VGHQCRLHRTSLSVPPPNISPTADLSRITTTQFAPGEEAAVINAFENLAHTQANGIALAGRKYSVISGEPIRLLGMSQSFGCILLKTTQTIIVGQCDPPIQLAEMQLFVERLGDYLKGIGY